MVARAARRVATPRGHSQPRAPGARACIGLPDPATNSPHVPHSTKESVMREAVIVASSRTGLAKSFRGSFNLTRPDDMAAHCVKDLLKTVPQLAPAEIEDVVMGTGFRGGPQGVNGGRNVARRAAPPAT